MNRIYKAITYIFFPGTMGVLGFLLPIMLFPPFHLPWHFWPAIVFCYAAFPVLGIMVLVKLGYLKDIHVYDRKLRNKSYPIAILGALLGMIYLHLFPTKYAYEQFTGKWSLAIALALGAIWLVNNFVKASAHMCGAAGFLAATLVLYHWGWHSNVWIYNALIICALVYMARLGLSAHSHFELLLGFGLGFITTFAVLSL